MNPAFNPQPTFPFCTMQEEMFCFITKQGFAAVDLDQIQGFQSVSEDETLAQFGSRIFMTGDPVFFDCVESVPDLVARYAELKKRRRSPLTQVNDKGQLTSVAAPAKAAAAPATPNAAAVRGVNWKS